MVRRKVSVIVVNWNGKRFLQGCLESLRSLAYPNVEIIFVDNGSTDGSAEFVERKFRNVRVLRLKRNWGFAKANNFAFAMAKGDYVVTLNNDTLVTKDWLTRLVAVGETDERIGSCASKVLLMTDPPRIGSTGELILRTGNVIMRGFYEIDHGQYDKLEQVFGTGGGGVGFYKRAMLEELGELFDENYFAWFEDVDLMWRAQRNGWKCVYVPDAVVYHFHSGTVRENSNMKLFYLRRNRLYFIAKNYPARLLARYSMSLLRPELGFLKYCFREGRLPLLRAYPSALRLLPVALRARSQSDKNWRRLAGWIENCQRHFDSVQGRQRVKEYNEARTRLNNSTHQA
jgi:GT2 family glycosyltransferase